VNFALFGYPKTGKTTLFDILTGAHAAVSAVEDGKREAHEKICHVPDARLDRISALHPGKKKVAAAVDFIDLAGISFGEVKTSVFLNALRKADGLVHVVRGFHDDNVPHAKPAVDPADDIRTMEEELLLADLISVESRLEKIEKDLKKMKNPEEEREREILARLRKSLADGCPVRNCPLTDAEEKNVRAFAFLSQKPILHAVNLDETDVGRRADFEASLAPKFRAGAVLAFCGRIEREILEFDDDEEKSAFRSEYGLAELTADRFFPAAFAVMDQIFFYTIGKDEVRAWPLRRDAPAVQAAGAIHTDIERGFIRAEVVPAARLIEFGSIPAAKEKGCVRLEGKDYPVQDGDVIYFRFNA
jgi:GTP-binding protein YchF